MIRNPFARKPKTPIDQAVDAFDSVRSDAAGYAATIRDAAADIAETLTEIGPPAPKGRKVVPLLLGVAAAGLGIAYLLGSKDKGGAPAYAPEVPKEPPVAAVPTPTEQPPLKPTPAEEAKEIRTATPEAEAAKDAGEEPATAEKPATS